MADHIAKIRERLADRIKSGFMGELERADLWWAVNEIDRLKAENAQLREAMPSKDVIDTIREMHREETRSACGQESASGLRVLAWLDRLDAARGGSNG